MVVGAARSGIAAAELLRATGRARDAHRSAADVRRHATGCERLGVELELGGHTADTLAAADLIVASPGVPLEQPVFDARARARRGDHRRAGARVAVGAGPHHRDHGHERKVDDDDAHRPDAERGRPARCSWAETSACRSARRSTPRRRDTVHVVEASSFQLETTIDVQAVDRAVAQRRRRPSRSACRHRRRTPRPRRASSRISDAGDWAVVNADDRGRARRGAPRRGARRSGSRPRGRVAEGFVVDGEWIVRRTGTAQRAAGADGGGRADRAPHARQRAGRGAPCRGWRESAPRAMTRGAARASAGSSTSWSRSGEIGGVRFVNDSKATNVDAARRSIESFERASWPSSAGGSRAATLRELARAASRRAGAPSSPLARPRRWCARRSATSCR